MGDSIVQFSLIIGFYLASMGIGSFLTRFFTSDNVLVAFIGVEMLLGLIGAFSVPLCYLFFALTDASGYQFFVLSLISLIGALTGFEIPLLTRILESKSSFEKNISDVLTFDYLGALGATLLFPFFLLPFIGLYRSSLLFGLINLIVALVTLQLFKDKLSIRNQYKYIVRFGILFLSICIAYIFIQADNHIDRWNESIYKYPVIQSEQSKYQKIDLVKNNSEFRLYLNGALQFSSRDEYIYHESLVHVPLGQIDNIDNVLVLGGGEGLAIREILKYPELKQVVVVDIDPKITELSKSNHLINRLNDESLKHTKVRMVHEDAFRFLSSDTAHYSAIIVDLPDPSNEALARLYSDSFYKLCIARLAEEGILSTQATSPSLSTNAFWCIEETLQYSGFDYTYPYSAYVPSFGTWGFIMAKKSPRFKMSLREDIDMRYLEQESLQHMFYFPKNIRNRKVAVNLLDKPILLDYYLEHWRSLQGQKR